MSFQLNCCGQDDLVNLTESSVAIWLASCMGNKAETAVHSCHCPGDMAVRMRKVLASQAVGWCSSGPFAFIVVFLHMVRRMDGWLASLQNRWICEQTGSFSTRTCSPRSCFVILRSCPQFIFCLFCRPLALAS